MSECGRLYNAGDIKLLAQAFGRPFKGEQAYLQGQGSFVGRWRLLFDITLERITKDDPGKPSPLHFTH